MSKNFFNSSIFGAAIGEGNRRGFRAINPANLPPPKYDPRFFESFPTLWAQAYTFRKALETTGSDSGENQENIGKIALEEWATLFMLFYFGAAHLRRFEQDELQKNFDPDLWFALNGTYPRPRGETNDLEFVSLLQANDGTVIGAYYPQIVFFPVRGREAWHRSESLQPFLKNNRLSWENSEAQFRHNAYWGEFQSYLRSIPAILPEDKLKTALTRFCENLPGRFAGELINLDFAPENHPRGFRPASDEDLLRAYPLKKTIGGRTIFYLLDEVDLKCQPDWANKSVNGLPAPSFYRQGEDGEIVVRYQNQNRVLPHKRFFPNSETVQLKDLLLSNDDLEKAFFCVVDASDNQFARFVDDAHNVAVRHLNVEPGQSVVCLAPLKKDFFEHFPQILDAENVKKIVSKKDENGGVTWTLPLDFDGGAAKEFCWYSRPEPYKLAATTLSIYPPKVAENWKLYIGYGTGKKDTTGRWHLIDEEGNPGKEVALDSETYVSYLHRDGDAPCRPRAMMLKDAGDRERGVLFLSPLPPHPVDNEGTAKLAVDFGTSNTCLAVRVGGEAEILEFSLKALPVWGKPPDYEPIGMVPQKWADSERGFFPTVLLSRLAEGGLAAVKANAVHLEHLFKVDVPGLHKDISEKLFTGDLDDKWEAHYNLKWTADTEKPWRALFLRLILLYAHAEVFFNPKFETKIGSYVFTFPLAFSAEYGDEYDRQAKGAIRAIRKYCFGTDENVTEYASLDESQAVARSLEGESEGMEGTLQIFLDIGGGTTDIAIRHGKEFLVLDSLRVAGKSYFKFARKNFGDAPKVSGAKGFRTNMGRVLYGQPRELNLNVIKGKLKNRLDDFYSVAVNEISESEFTSRETSVLTDGIDESAYQTYRSRLFFRHLIAYALLQACAVAVADKERIKLHDKSINLIFGGNGWGLLLFAGWQRNAEELQAEAQKVLEKIIPRLLETLTDDKDKEILKKLAIGSVDLLNANNLSKAKTSVARGALNGGDANLLAKESTPYVGMTIAEMSLNDSSAQSVDWYERWSLPNLVRLFEKDMETISTRRVGLPVSLEQPFSKVLSVFTALGNASDIGADISYDGMWRKINGQINGGLQKFVIKNKKPTITIDESTKETVTFVPLNYFLSEILYSQETDATTPLDKLAEKNFSNGKKSEG